MRRWSHSRKRCKLLFVYLGLRPPSRLHPVRLTTELVSPSYYNHSLPLTLNLALPQEREAHPPIRPTNHKTLWAWGRWALQWEVSERNNASSGNKWWKSRPPPHTHILLRCNKYTLAWISLYKHTFLRSHWFIHFFFHFWESLHHILPLSLSTRDRLMNPD